MSRISIPCPLCRHEKIMSVAEIRNNSAYLCTGCGKLVHFAANNFCAHLVQAGTQIKSAVANVKRILWA